MREIKFRGKRKDNGEWIYGFYSPLIWYPSGEQTPSIKGLKGGDYEISVKTLGQYTGLKDKNGKEIYEGDIVKLKETNYNYEWIAIVEFGNPNSEYVWGWNLKPITKDVEYNLDILCWVEMPIGATCEIIGNIHDNPELIGEIIWQNVINVEVKM